MPPPSPSPSPSPPPAAVENPKEWRFIWEAQSHTSILRLLLSNPTLNPSAHCTNLKLNLQQQSLLILSFFAADDPTETSIRVPLPRVLIDPDSPIHFRAHDDHIEAKLVLLLPVDRFLVSGFDLILDLEEERDELCPLEMDSDVKVLSCMEEVHFYCRNCFTKLTKGLRCFEEMPSVNWRDAADNWFGNCCCSFGGVSEELVEKYVKSYSCSPGVCLLNTTSILLCKDDLVGCEFPDVGTQKNVESDSNSSCNGCLRKVSVDEVHTHVQVGCLGNHEKGLLGTDTAGNSVDAEADILSITENGILENVVEDSSSVEEKVWENGQNQGGNCSAGCCPSHGSGTLSKLPINRINSQVLENQKVFQDGYLGNGFMVRSSGVSKDIQWINFLCPNCLSLIGAYPCFDDSVPLDGGIRLFKCCISTSSADSGSINAFGKYTLERMFTCQLLEYAEDELSFRTIVRDIQTKSPVLQIILLNPNSWCFTGRTTEPAAKLVLYPTVKMLFSIFNDGNESDPSRTLEDRVRKNQVDEIFMFSSQIRELIRACQLGNGLLPPSYKSLQGLSLSSLRR